MQRFVNNPDYVVEDMLKGFLKAHDDLIVKNETNDRVVQYKNTPVEGKVGLVTGGGSGHEPAFLGYVGENMMDAVAVGEVFSSPSAQAFYDAFMAADSGKGVACLFGNYAGQHECKNGNPQSKKTGSHCKICDCDRRCGIFPERDKGKTPWNRRRCLHVENCGSEGCHGS